MTWSFAAMPLPYPRRGSISPRCGARCASCAGSGAEVFPIRRRAMWCRSACSAPSGAGNRRVGVQFRRRARQRDEMSDETKPTSPPTVLDATQVRTMLPDPRRLSSNALGAVPEAQRYREHGLLGRGGMGEIMLVEDAAIGREIAVKTIAAKLAGSRSMRERFLREVRIQGQLEHPSIVPVYDVGVDASGNDYFTMKRIAGRTLATVLRALAANDAGARQEFPRNALLAVFRQICLAIAFAHSRGAIHRDLKPANVMVGDFGEVYVLDWGIARLATEPDPPPSDEQVLGTPGYMAPEQLEDPAQADDRSDVYALGAILFEILALEPWHPAASVAA